MREGLSYEEMPVTVLPGVGRVKKEQFERLGVRDISDLLYFFPKGYQNRGEIALLGEASLLSVNCATVLTVGSDPSSVRLRGGKVMTRFTAFDDSGKCVVTFFNQPFVKDIFIMGSAFRFWGKVEKKGRNFTMSCPEYEPYGSSKPLADFKSVYKLTKGLNSKGVSLAVGAALLRKNELRDPIPESVRRDYGLMPLGEALEAIHFPKNYEELDRARRRFIFEELFLFSLGMQMSGERKSIRKEDRLVSPDMSVFTRALPFPLTGAQARTLGEIGRDMTSDKPMTRLVCGDVGSGKTACAAGAIYIALKNGRQAALMAPTEILANQHFASLAPFFEALGFSTVLLVGSLNAAAKRKARERIAAGEADLVIGTHALLTDDTVFADLALVIADEQHRFGVGQRSSLSEKGKDVHTLVMTATPIPRTLALILYNGLDISYIDEMPPGRQKVRTYAVDESYRDRLNGFIRKQAEEGHQTFVVCPAVEQDENEEEKKERVENGRLLPFDFRLSEERQPTPPLKAAVQFAGELQQALPDLRIGFVHGKMKSKEKDAVMDAFTKGELQVLVSTTVIEVGVNIPNATLMIVENAERFGLSQLHQLRGRVGRGKAQSYCVLVSDCPENSTARKRLETICKTQKGLEIANEDLKIRGPGDFFPSASGDATRQSGEFSFRLASSCTDATMPEKAMSAAKRLLRADPHLDAIEDLAALARVRKLFALTEHTMN